MTGSPVHSGSPIKPARRRLGIALLVGLAVVIAVLVALSLPALTNPRHVPARVFMMTLMGFQHRTPGPWPDGNNFSLAPRSGWIMCGPIGRFVREYAPNDLTGGSMGWSVVNMTAENYSEIVRQLKIESVEILILDKHTCLVVDARIPREWFRQLPSVSESRTLVMQRAVADYPDKFSLPAAAEPH